MVKGTGKSFAEKLSNAIETFHDPEAPPMSLSELARRCEEVGGVTTSHNYLSELRSGRATNPKLHVVIAIAQALGIPPRYFVDDEFAAALLAERRLKALETEGDIQLRFRSGTITQQDVDILQDMVDRAREIAREREDRRSSDES